MAKTKTTKLATTKAMKMHVKTEICEILKESAKQSKTTVPKLIEKLVEKHLSLVAKKDEEITVILKIPVELKKDAVAMESWLNVRKNAIIHNLCKQESTNAQ